MNPSQGGPDIMWLDTAQSTNRAVREASSRLDNLSVIAAVEQTAGRGQGTHTWHSLPGENLTFSLLARPCNLQTSEIICITCATTLGIRDYLLSRGVSSRIKWPNDIWVDDRKICGILIENKLDGNTVAESIIGIGLNLNQTSWPADLPNPVSLKQITGKDYDTHAELEVLAEKICRRLSLLDSAIGRKKLQEEFGKNVFRLHEEP
ncbi:MAG: biotin--[acetyl-CoA-carboxylase] ligase [Bacteroidales bacterium]|nr:biotin--[acetyl-CoA-carboxylase] ligase [Bacteroidales bacterium]